MPENIDFVNDSVSKPFNLRQLPPHFRVTGEHITQRLTGTHYSIRSACVYREKHTKKANPKALGHFNLQEAYYDGEGQLRARNTATLELYVTGVVQENKFKAGVIDMDLAHILRDLDIETHRGSYAHEFRRAKEASSVVFQA